jgi:hypothetical protein
MQGALVIGETFDGSRGGAGKEHHQNQGRRETTGYNPELAASLPYLLHKTLAPKIWQFAFSTSCL